MRFLHRSFIVIFMAMLTLPLIFVDLSSENRISVQENRMLAEFPKLTDLKRHQRRFIRDFDAWFKDSTGFREQMLALFNIFDKNRWLNNNIQYKEGIQEFLIGEQGHHYWTNRGKLISVFQGKPVLSDEQLASMAVKLEEVKTYLDKQGIPFIVMFCTVKESIYPEFYPKSIIRGLEPIQLDVITNYLKDHTSVDVFNIRQALLAEKSNYLLYPINGDVSALSHYNNTGAFFAYRELMKHINVYFPGIIPFELKDIDISTEYNLSIKTNITYKELDSSFFNNIGFSDIDFFNTSFNSAYENTTADLPTILFLRTSFLYPSRLLFAQHFGKTIMTYFVNMGHLEEYVNKWKPDIVIFETVEWQFDMFADAVIGMPKLP